MAQERQGSTQGGEQQQQGKSGSSQFASSEGQRQPGQHSEQGQNQMQQGQQQFQQGKQRFQQGQQGGDGQRYGQQRKSTAANLTMTTLRGLGQFYDMQAATTRIMLRAQARAASALGLPDYSRLFEINDERALHLFSDATENLAQFVEQKDDAFTEVPSQVFRMIEQQAIDANERWKHGLEELQHQATESIEELKELSRQQAEEFKRATESLSDVGEETMREGGEQLRATMRQGREAAGRQMEETGEAFGRAAGEMKEAGEEGGKAVEQAAGEVEEGAERSQRVVAGGRPAEPERGGARPRPGATTPRH